jgi:tetratricopeptide (TPR) repeat protein
VNCDGMTMTTDSFTNRLSEYLDGELSSPERAAVDAHLLQCAACRATLVDLRGVVSEAALLGDAPPARELWSGIAARIAPGKERRARVSPFRRAISSRLSFTLPQLAAAGIAVMVLSGGLVWMARSGDRRADFEPINAQTEPRSDMPVIAQANFADPHYDEAIADLERTLEAGRTKLDPETVRVLEENLGAIDRAIDQCRRALATDPANVYLNTHLADARQRKLTLLRRATTLAQLGS